MQNIPSQNQDFQVQQEVLVFWRENQEVFFDDLKPNTTYNFRVVVRQSEAEEKSSPILHITTPSKRLIQTQAEKPKLAHSPVVSELSTTSATIEIELTEKARITLHFGTDKNSLTAKAASDEALPWHKIVLRALKPNTVYFYKVTIGSTTSDTFYRFRTPIL